MSTALESAEATRQTVGNSRDQPRLFIGLEGGKLEVDEEAVTAIFGQVDPGYVRSILQQIAPFAGGPDGTLKQDALDFIATSLGSLKPTNALEMMLSVQIIANHICAMKTGAMLASASTQQKMEALEKIFTKLARTATTQAEALHKLRNGGKQSVTVYHVNVEDGGQAVVGELKTGGRGG